MMTPARLVAAASCAAITSFTLASKTAVATHPAAWVDAATDYDIVRSNPGFETLTMDNSATTSTNTFTFTSTPDASLAVGDYICLAGESCIPQIPYALHPLLAHRVVLRSLEALGDPKAKFAAETCSELAKSALTLLSPRSEGSSRFVVNRNGPGFARHTYGRWRY